MDVVRFSRGQGDVGAVLLIEVNAEPLADVIRRVEQPFADAEGHPSMAGDYAPLDEWRLKESPAQHLRGSTGSHLHCGPRDKTVL